MTTIEASSSGRKKCPRGHKRGLVPEGGSLPPIKRRKHDNSAKLPSLISAMSAKQTASNGVSQPLQGCKGTVLFPSPLDTATWSPPVAAKRPNEGARVFELPRDLDTSMETQGNAFNTLLIQFRAPIDSKRFSINIAGPDHGNFSNVLFHFNPRQYHRGGQVVPNNKQQDRWGKDIAIPLSEVPAIFGKDSCTLVIQISNEGFDVFLEGHHCARLKHRAPLPQRGPLFLQFPSTNEYGDPEKWNVQKVWWGSKGVMAKSDLSGVAGADTLSPTHPRKLFIWGLPRISTETEVDWRRAQLERAFQKYGGDTGVLVTVPTKKTFAFVELETKEQSDLALKEMSSHFRLSRARRTRYEALKEERSAERQRPSGV